MFLIPYFSLTCRPVNEKTFRRIDFPCKFSSKKFFYAWQWAAYSYLYELFVIPRIISCSRTSQRDENETQTFCAFSGYTCRYILCPSISNSEAGFKPTLTNGPSLAQNFMYQRNFEQLVEPVFSIESNFHL